MPGYPASSHPDLRSLVDRWQGHLLARNLSPHTIDGYLRGVRQFIDFLEAAEWPSSPVSIRRNHIEGFIAEVLDHKSDSTARTRYRDLSVFFNWLREEGAVESSPMTHVKRPRAEEKQIPIIPEQDLRRLLSTCSGPGFRDRRDKAILLFFLDTGARLSEVAELLVADIKLKRRTVTVRGKGRRQRKLPLSVRVRQALADYREARSRHVAAGDDRWWLGPKGPFSPSNIRQMCWRR